MGEISRPLPTTDEPDTGPFWRATQQGELRYQACSACAAVVFPPRRHCPNCASLELAWHRSAGTGTVHACTTTFQHSSPYFRSRTPYIIGLIDLDEGFRMLAELSPGADPAPGTRVRVSWEGHESLKIPIFLATACEPVGRPGEDAGR